MTWAANRLLTGLCAASLLVSMSGASVPAAAAERIDTASLTPGTEILRDVGIPTVLAGPDATRYREIFRLQAAGNWAAANLEIAQLKDRTLLGHVEAQRYLHRKYKASYAELKAWLDQYPDLPDARQIHALAYSRQPKGTKPPAQPVGAPVPLLGRPDAPADLRPPARASTKATSEAERARGQALKSEIRRLARSEPDAAERLLAGPEAQRLFDDSEYDDSRVDVAEGYLFAGEDQKALALAAQARTPAYRPLAHWDAGLAAWRLGRLGEARSHFEALTRLPGVPEPSIAAAAYWASRVHLRARRPQLVSYWLGIAANHPRSFYGMLARRALGIDTYYDFAAEPFTAFDAQALIGLPGGRRALALLQVGEAARAEMEVRHLVTDATPALLPSLVALADRGNMPAVSLQLARMISERDGRRHDHAAFPVPRWEPKGGYKIDRALLFGLMRQESEFMPKAESAAGARGLMQVMPATAQEVAIQTGIALTGRDARNKPVDQLCDPETNLAIAQHYVGGLMTQEKIRGNLLLLAAAYNSGPGNVAKWQVRPEYQNDPLLFLESMPSRETRVFVQRVLTNYWSYRMRLGQQTTDLDALAAGRWPVYVALDKTDEVTRNAAAR
jgi:soluble lytic murein transglycosylase